MNNSMILKDKYEINKSSDLCQVIYYKNTNSKIPDLFNISATQLDLLNILFYKSHEALTKGKIDLSLSDTTMVTLNLMDFSKMLSKYENSEYLKLVEYLEDLSDLKVIINALNKNKNIQEMTITRFILSITVSKHLNSNKKMIRVMMDNKILARVHNLKTMFTKMYLTIQFSLVSKYSKLLYELLKDYEKINKRMIAISTLYDLLNVTEESMRVWSRFRAHILMKAITEINEKSDIVVSFEPIKEKPDGERLQVTKIKFNIEKQPESRLQALGLIQQTVTENKYYNKSKSKLDKLVKNGYKVIDEEKWIETDIKNNQKRYDDETRIDTWLKETSQDDKIVIFESLASYLDDCNEPTVCIDDYKIIGVFSKEVFTKNPTETITIMNEVLTAMAENENDD